MFVCGDDSASSSFSSCRGFPDIDELGYCIQYDLSTTQLVKSQ